MSLHNIRLLIYSTKIHITGREIQIFLQLFFITRSSFSRVHKLHYPIIPTTATTDIDNKNYLYTPSTPQKRAIKRLGRAQNMTISKKYRKKFGQIIKRLYFCTRKNGITYALLAQLVEQLTLNQWVQGSNPWECTSFVLCNFATLCTLSSVGRATDS